MRKNATAQSLQFEILDAISSVNKCSPNVLSSIQHLLSPKNATQQDVKAKVSATSTARGAAGRKTAATTTKSGGTVKTSSHVVVFEEKSPSLSAEERGSLAIEIVNRALQRLSSPKAGCNRKETTKSNSTTVTSLFTPGSDTRLRDVPSNRLTPSATMTKPSSRITVTTKEEEPDPTLTIIECASAAFQYLRKDRTAMLASDKPDYKLEYALTAFVGQLLALQYISHAVKELQGLRSLLQAHFSSNSGKPNAPCGSEAAEAEQRLTLASLLHFSVISTDTACVLLAVNYQILVLKAIHLTKQPRTIEAAVQYFDPNAKSSPVHLLSQLIKNEDHKDQGARLLENVARLLLGLCPGLSTSADEVANDSSQSPSPHTCLQIQTTAFQAQLTWMHSAQHTGDIDLEICKPVLHCFKAYVRRCPSTIDESYNTAKTCASALSSKLKQLGMEGRCGASWAQLQVLLSKLAKNAGKPLDALAYLSEEAGPAENADPSTSKTVIRCARMAAIKLKSPSLKLNVHAIDEFKELIQLLENNAIESRDELVKALHELLQLGQLLLPILNPASTSSQDNPSKSQDITICHTVFYLSLRLFLAYWTCKAIEREDSEPGDEEDTKLQTSAYMVIRTLAFCMATQSIANIIDHERLDATLHDSIKLCEVLASPLPGSTNDSGGTSISQTSIIAISNAYWAAYTRFKDSKVEQHRALGCLRSSCECLQKRSKSIITSGHLMGKQLKLAQTFQEMGNFAAAKDAFMAVVSTAIECGILQEIADAAMSDIVESAWSINSDSKTLWQAVEALLQLDARGHAVLPAGQVYLDLPDLPTDIRCALLERQLYMDKKWLNSITLKSRTKAITLSVLPLLLELYNRTETLAQWRRIATQTLHYAIDHPGDFNTKILNIAMTDPATSIDETDINLGMIATTSRMLLSIIRCIAKFDDDESHYEATISALFDISQSCSSLSNLQKAVGDLEAWRNQLNLLADYLHLHGYNNLELRTLHILVKFHELAGKENNLGLASVRIRIGRLLLEMGYVAEAGVHILRADNKVNSDCGHAIRASSQLALSEYYRCSGNFEQSLVYVVQADDHHSQHAQAVSRSSSREEKLANIYLECDLLCTRASLLWDTGSQHKSLGLQAQAVSTLQRAWKSIEAASATTQTANVVDTAMDTVNEAMSKLDIRSGQVRSGAPYKAPHYWRLAPRLCEALLQLARMIHWAGLYEDSLYYAAQALEVAEHVESKALIGMTLVKQGELLARGGELKQSQTLLRRADPIYTVRGESYEAILHNISLGLLHHLENKWPKELEIYQKATTIIKHLSSQAPFSDFKLVSKQSPSEIKAKVVARTTHTAKTMQKKQQGASGPPPKSSSSSGIPEPTLQVQLKIVESRLVRSMAEALLAQGNLVEAAAVLDAAPTIVSTIEYQVQQHSTIARRFLAEAISIMESDPSFSMLSESIVSMPSAVRQRSRGSSLGSTTQAQPVTSKQRRIPNGSAPRGSKPKTENTALTPTCAVAFGQAYDNATASASKLMRLCSVNTMTEACIAATTSAMLTSFAFPNVSKASLQPVQVAWSIELPHMEASLRERAYIGLEATRSGQDGKVDIETVSSLANREDLGLSSFQANFVDIIPSHWTAISMYVDEHCEHLHVIRYEANRSPFVIRLPLNRQNLEDPDEETFTFQDAQEELRAIIDASDATVHAARDDTEAMKQKGAKTKWWAEREALNDRLKDVLANIENMWFAGFRGIFSQHQYRPELVARLQQSLDNILDKHLPSRQKLSAAKRAEKVVLDSHVLDLFIGLTYKPSPDVDVDEALTDLLYYVVDILQFNGEANAYDEIDFDSLVLDTQDALQSYHEASASEQRELSPHTILILDKQLHGIPWESMPCLDGHSVSRLSSLYDLRERLLMMKSPSDDSAPGFHIPCKTGTYILNPSRDLAKTQSRFEKPLCSLTSWSNIIDRAPSETEFCNALTPPSCTESSSPNSSSSSLLLYFGHGSGAQYVRSRRIKRLRLNPSTTSTPTPASTSPPSQSLPPAAPTLSPTCNTTLLFGCSSASLRTASEFEPFGTPKTYLAAGAPALLGSLWDVTDGDCDAFAGGVLERWGLLEQGACKESEAKRGGKRGKGKGKSAVVKSGGEAEVAGGEGGKEGRMCLSEAVAKSRGECYLRYLNGAAMVVYGVPVFLA